MSEIVYVDRVLDRDTGELLDLTPGGLCQKCSEIGYTCCQPAYGVSLSFHDAARIMKVHGLELAEFCVLNVIEDDDLVEGLKMDPQFAKLFIGKRRLLQHVQRGESGLDCYFLGPEGCTIFEDRPRLCHFHPFWFERDGKGRSRVFFDSIDDREDADEADCLVVNKLWPNLGLGLKSVGETPETFGLHARAMHVELDWHAEQVEDLLADKKPKQVTLEDLADIVSRVELDLEV